MADRASRRRSSSILSSASRDEALDQHGARLVQRDAARAQVEQQVRVDLGRGGAMAADHVVGIDLELGLGVELRLLRQHERLRHLLAVGLLRVGAHDHLALEDAARAVGQHALEQLAALAARHRMIDDQRGVDVLGAAAEEAAGDVELAALALEGGEQMVAHERRCPPSAGRRDRWSRLAELRHPAREVAAGIAVERQLDVRDVARRRRP